MNITSRSIALALVLGLSACAQQVTTTGSSEPVVDSIPPVTVAPSVADGTYFGFVSVGEDGEKVVVDFDQAEMLSGQEAHDAAVAAGVITADEDLPNDVFIVNPDESTERVNLASDAVITMLSAEDPAATLDIDAETLGALFAGGYEGPSVYGVVPGQPMPMMVDIAGDVITAARAVYLP